MSPGILIDPNASLGLLESLNATPHEFLSPSLALHATALADAKHFLDPLATSTSATQEQRLQRARQKRKRGKFDDGGLERDILKLKNVHLDGFATDGVWGQAKRILDASATEIEKALRRRRTASYKLPSERAVDPTRVVRFDEEGFEIGSDEDEGSSGRGDNEEDSNYDLNEETSDLEEEGDITTSNGLPEGVDTDPEEDIEDISDLEDNESEVDHPSGTFVKDKHGLNDGFFDIDDFNKESEFLEQNAARGEDQDNSDEEDIDYFADPMVQSTITDLRKGKIGRQGRSEENNVDHSDDEENGPTFGNVDLNAPWSDDDDEVDDAEMGDLALENDENMGNANDIRYQDFFDPPSKPLSKSKRLRALPKTQPQQNTLEPSEEEVQRTIDSVRRDLFEDDFSDPDAASDENLGEDAPSMRNLSTHEKRKVALAKQIRELEAAAIEKRSWQLSGEASAHARPENALLEEDLEFERAGKPVPVITAEVSSTIEDMIKQRILSRQFDEVVKRRPGSEPGSNSGRGQPRRGLMELSDQKDPQSLAENYEEAYLAQNDPNAKDSRSEVLKAQHAEIEKLWSDVSSKLDALTSWRYKPKPAGVEVKVVTDAPKITIEDARPSGVEGIRGDQGRLAPQELFRVGEEGKNAEDSVIATKGGGVVAKDELTREQKLRRRRREKERMKKQGSGTTTASSAAKQDAVPAKTKKDEQSEVLKQLKAGGVKVIGKEGKLQDVEGQNVKSKATGSAGALKL